MSEDKKYIVELGSRDVRVISQLLHMAMLQGENSGGYPKVAKEVFSNFTNQVDGTSTNPRTHGVFVSDFTAPTDAVLFSGIYFLPPY